MTSAANTSLMKIDIHVILKSVSVILTCVSLATSKNTSEINYFNRLIDTVCMNITRLIQLNKVKDRTKIKIQIQIQKQR